MSAPPKPQHRRPLAWREQPRLRSQKARATLQQARAVVEATSRTDIVEQWKSQALRGAGGQPGGQGSRGSRLRLLTNWFRSVWQVHDSALGIDTLIARAEARLEADDPTAAAHIARRALRQALLEDYRVRLWRVMAWAGVGQRDPFLTHAAMLQLPAPSCTLDLVAAYLTTCNRTNEALALLTEARTMGHRSRATSKQLIELLVMHGASREASRLASEDRDLLGGDELAALADAGIAASVGPGNAATERETNG